MQQQIDPDIVNTFLAALRAGDETQARRIVQSVQWAGVDAGEIYLQIFTPSLMQIGELWARNKLSIAEEHIATGITERLIGELSPLFRSSAESERRIVLGCIQGENHALGIRMLADLFERAGWRVLYLGANVPTEEWPHIIARTNAQAVGMSVNNERLLAEARRAIAMIRTHLPTIHILVGGAAVIREPDLAELLRADVIALEPMAAIAALNDLM